MDSLGASGVDEKRLVNHVVEITNSNVRPVNNSLDAANVTLDITFHGVIEMVRSITFFLDIGHYIV